MSIWKPKKPWFIHCTILKKLIQKDLNAKLKTVKLLLENREENHRDLGLHEDGLDMTKSMSHTKPKKNTHHRTPGKLKFIGIKNCCTTALQNTVKRMKTQVAENILNHISDKELVTRNVDFSKLKEINQFKKCTRNLKRHCTKDDTQLENSPWKDVQHQRH